MTHLTTFKAILTFFVLILSLQLFGQTNEVGILKGKITDKNTREGISDAHIFVGSLSGEINRTEPDQDGVFMIEIPVGKNLFQVKHSSYKGYTKEIVVELNDTLEYEISLRPIEAGPPWKTSKPFAELNGFWKPVYYKKSGRKIKQGKIQDKSGLRFNFATDTLPGRLTWNSGCNLCGFLYFRHTGKGIIELQEKGSIKCMELNCENNNELEAFIHNMKGKEIKTKITKNGQLLKLTLENEKFVFQKEHDNNITANLNFSTDLFGSWVPVKAKMNRQKIRKFAEGAEFIIDWRSDFASKNDRIINVMAKAGEILYNDNDECSSGGIRATYSYSDKDFIQLFYFKKIFKNKICLNESIPGLFFDILSKYGGCHIQFNEAKDEVTLKYDKDFLILKRKE